METKYNKETVRDSLPTLKGRVSLSPELIKTREGTLLFAFETEDNTIKKTLEEAVRRGADLRGADLRGANLRGADLRGAKIDKKG